MRRIRRRQKQIGAFQLVERAAHAFARIQRAVGSFRRAPASAQSAAAGVQRTWSKVTSLANSAKIHYPSALMGVMVGIVRSRRSTIAGIAARTTIAPAK